VSVSSIRIDLSDDDDFETEVVGESHRQRELRDLEARISTDALGRRTFLANLRSEPENRADRNAVAVLAADNEEHLGYLTREVAENYHSALHQRGGAEVPAILFGGGKRKPTLGVWLDLTALNRILGIAIPSSEPMREPPKLGPDEHGQPFNVRFNRARRAERDLCELLGLARGLLADGVVSASEAQLLHDWVARHRDALDHWAVRTVHQRLTTHFADGCIDDAERADLKLLLDKLVSGEVSAVCDADAATTLPLDQPPPQIQWNDMTYVFTGKFAYGPRRDCEREVERRGGACESSVTKRTTFLVIGTFGSADWVHTAFGRKIEKAVSYRDAGVRLHIVAEDHWAAAL
jgi:hypothetical protein